MTILVKNKGERSIWMRAAGNPAQLEEKSVPRVISAINDLLRGNQDNIADSTLVKNLTGEDGQLLIPHEFNHDLNMKKKKNKSIRQYIDVVPVKAEKGNFTTEAEGNANDELVEFESGEFVEQDDMKLNGASYKIKSYGSFTPFPSSLMEDSGYDLFQLFLDNHSEKAVKTENKKVFNSIKTGLEIKELADVEALNTSLNKDFNPVLENEIVVITNQDGYEVLKPNLLFFRDESGKVKAYLDKYLVETYSNDDLTSSPGTVPVIYGATKQSVKLFDLERPEVLLVKHPYGIRVPVSVMRGVEHFDVKLMPNTTYTIYGELPTA